MHTLNKIIVQHSIKFYSKAWNHRNEVKHNPQKYKEFMRNWYENVIEMVQHENRPELSKYVRMQSINVDQCDAAYVVMWIKSVMAMKKKTKQEVINDIRRYMIFT